MRRKRPRLDAADSRHQHGRPEHREEELKSLENINVDEFKTEILSQEELFLKLASELPKEMVFQRELLISRL